LQIEKEQQVSVKSLKGANLKALAAAKKSTPQQSKNLKPTSNLGESSASKKVAPTQSALIVADIIDDDDDEESVKGDKKKPQNDDVDYEDDFVDANAD
jgi:hypothetical protein